MSRRARASAAITAADSFTDWVDISTDRGTVSVSGTFVATITVQRREVLANGSFGAIRDVEAYTSATEKTLDPGDSTHQYRVGAKTGQFTSGTANVLIVQ